MTKIVYMIIICILLFDALPVKLFASGKYPFGPYDPSDPSQVAKKISEKMSSHYSSTWIKELRKSYTEPDKKSWHNLLGTLRDEVQIKNQIATLFDEVVTAQQKNQFSQEDYVKICAMAYAYTMSYINGLVYSHSILYDKENFERNLVDTRMLYVFEVRALEDRDDNYKFIKILVNYEDYWTEGALGNPKTELWGKGCSDPKKCAQLGIVTAGGMAEYLVKKAKFQKIAVNPPKQIP